MQENQATVRDLSIGETFKDRMISMLEIIKEPEAPLTDQVRCISALFTMHAGMFVLKDVEGDPEDKRKAVLEVAIDLVTQAHGHGPRATLAPLTPAPSGPQTRTVPAQTADQTTPWHAGRPPGRRPSRSWGRTDLEVQVRAAGVTGVAGQGDLLTGGTSWPILTSIFDRWAYCEYVPLACLITMALPYAGPSPPPFRPALTTVPPCAAMTLVPIGTAKSWPECLWDHMPPAWLKVADSVYFATGSTQEAAFLAARPSWRTAFASRRPSLDLRGLRVRRPWPERRPASARRWPR